MIKMTFKNSCRKKKITCRVDDLTGDTDHTSKYPTGLYESVSEGREEVSNILYFGRGQWIRNQRACGNACYNIQYVGPVRLDVILVDEEE